ncbi:hypothetical protein N9R98_00790 [bacterium]|nr:hypothetical protein [bacterium]
MKKILLLPLLLYGAVLPVFAFWGPTDRLYCRRGEVKGDDGGRPVWDLRVEMFDDHVGLTQVIDKKGYDNERDFYKESTVKLMPAVINKGYAQFEWDWPPDDPDFNPYKITVDRRKNTLTMLGGGPNYKYSSLKPKIYNFKCSAE